MAITDDSIAARRIGRRSPDDERSVTVDRNRERVDEGCSSGASTRLPSTGELEGRQRKQPTSEGHRPTVGTANAARPWARWRWSWPTGRGPHTRTARPRTRVRRHDVIDEITSGLRSSTSPSSHRPTRRSRRQTGCDQRLLRHALGFTWFHIDDERRTASRAGSSVHADGSNVLLARRDRRGAIAGTGRQER
jgi:hypothetical protein